MKRLFLFLVAGVTGWWGYRQLRRHPRTADKIAEIERQGQRLAEQAGDAVRSAKDQAVGRAADAAGAATTGTQAAMDTAAGKARDAIDSAAGKAHEAVDTAAQKARQAISPIDEKITEARD